MNSPKTPWISRGRWILLSLNFVFSQGGPLCWAGNSADGKIVYHIQDVHLNREAQDALGIILSQLVRNKKIQLIGLEGGFDSIPLGPFLEHPRRDLLMQSVDDVRETAGISGAVIAGLRGDLGAVPLVGVDDPDLYAQNVDAYQNAYRQNTQNRKALIARQKYLEREKKLLYNERLRTLDELLHREKKGETSLVEVAQALAFANPGPTHLTFLRLLEIEESRKTSPLTKNQKDHVKKNRVLDVQQLGQEIAQAGERGLLLLAKTPEEKVLVRWDLEFQRVTKAVDFSLTFDEWEKFSKTPRSPFAMTNFPELFYRSAEARNTAMADRLIVAMDQAGAQRAALVAGGFHTPGLEKAFHNRGVTMITITPPLKKIPDNATDYLSWFNKRPLPEESVLLTASFLAPDPFSEVAQGAVALRVACGEGRLSAETRRLAPNFWKHVFKIDGKHGFIKVWLKTSQTLEVGKKGARFKIKTKTEPALFYYWRRFLENIRHRLETRNPLPISTRSRSLRFFKYPDSRLSVYIHREGFSEEPMARFRTRFDRVNNQLYDDENPVPFREFTKRMGEKIAHLFGFFLEHPETQPLIALPTGNIGMNSGYRLYKNGRLYQSNDDETPPDQLFDVIAMDREGKPSFQSVRFVGDGSAVHLEDEKGNRLDHIAQAVQAPVLVKNGRSHLLKAALSLVDVRHLLRLPVFKGADLPNPRPGRESDEAIIGFSDGGGILSTDSTVRIRALLGEEIELDLRPIEKLGVSPKDVRRVYIKWGYRVQKDKKPMKPGTFRINAKTSTLTVRFLPGIQPHTFVGLDKNNGLLVAGSKGKSNHEGISLKAAVHALINEGAVHVLLWANGKDAEIDHAESTTSPDQVRGKSSGTLFVFEKTPSPLDPNSLEHRRALIKSLLDQTALDFVGETAHTFSGNPTPESVSHFLMEKTVLGKRTLTPRDGSLPDPSFYAFTLGSLLWDGPGQGSERAGPFMRKIAEAFMDQNLTDTPIALTSPDNLPEHHAKGHAVIRHAPLYLLCQGANPVFRRNYGESSIDTDTTDPLEQEKITKTLEIIRAWQKERASKGEDPLRDFISWLPNFLNEVTLVGVDYPAELIFADPVRGVARPMNIGRHRKVIYITRRFLKRFLNTDETVELATFILHQMEWCFLFSTARENKESPEQIQNRLLHHTLNALRVDRYFSTVSPPDLDKRLRGSLRQHLEDEAVCVVPLYLSKIQELETLRTTLGTESPSPTLYHVRDDNRTVVFRVLKLTEQLGLMARAMGREEEAQFFFEQHTVWVEWFQRREGGLLPFNTRINLLRDLLTDNEYEKFYRTLKNFLVEKNFVHPPLDLNWADHLSVHMETFRQRDIPSIREMIEKSVETAEGLGNKEGKDWLIRAQRLLADYVQETRDKQRDDDDLPPPGNPFSGEPGSSVETKPNRLSLLKLKFLEYQSRPFYSRWVFLSLFKKTASKPFIVVVDVSPLFGPENNDRTALVEHLNALDTARRKTEGLGVFAGFYGTPPSKEEWLRQSDALDLPPKVVHFVTNKIITDQTINLLGSAQIIQATEVLEQALPKTGLSETEWKKLWSSQGCVLDLYAGRDAPVAMDDPLLHEFYILLKGLFVSPVRQIQEWQEKLSVLSQSA